MKRLAVVALLGTAALAPTAGAQSLPLSLFNNPVAQMYAAATASQVYADPCRHRPELWSPGAMNWLSRATGRRVIGIYGPQTIAAAGPSVTCRETIAFADGATSFGDATFTDPGGNLPLQVTWSAVR